MDLAQQPPSDPACLVVDIELAHLERVMEAMSTSRQNQGRPPHPRVRFVLGTLRVLREVLRSRDPVRLTEVLLRAAQAEPAVYASVSDTPTLPSPLFASDGPRG